MCAFVNRIEVNYLSVCFIVFLICLSQNVNNSLAVKLPFTYIVFIYLKVS